METILSRNNPAIITASKLGEKKARDEANAFAFEGYKLFCEAAAAGADFHRVFVTEDAYLRYGEALSQAVPPEKLTLVSSAVYEKLSFEKAPQGIFTVISLYTAPVAAENDFVLLLDGVADPGNLGAILRSADAFGVGEVVLGPGCADLYHPRTVRACMGSLFRVPCRRTEDLAMAARALTGGGFRLYAAMLDEGAKDLRTLDFEGKIGFVIGNEGHGISPGVYACCTGSLLIPMRKGPESLNAAVAASVILWEAARGERL